MKDETIYPAGTKVCKKSGKPFKSGRLTNTVKCVVESPYKIEKETGRGVTSYTFVEDDSIVSAHVVTTLDKLATKKVGARIRGSMRRRGEAVDIDDCENKE